MSTQFEAVITDDQMRQAERIAEDWGYTRRCSMAFLARGTADIKVDDEFVDTIGVTLDSLTEYLKWRENETEMLETAKARMLCLIQNWLDEKPEEGTKPAN